MKRSHLIWKEGVNVDDDELEEYWELEDLGLFSLAR